MLNTRVQHALERSPMAAREIERRISYNSRFSSFPTAKLLFLVSGRSSLGSPASISRAISTLPIKYASYSPRIQKIAIHVHLLSDWTVQFMGLSLSCSWMCETVVKWFSHPMISWALSHRAQPRWVLLPLFCFSIDYSWCSPFLDLDPRFPTLIIKFVWFIF